MVAFRIWGWASQISSWEEKLGFTTVGYKNYSSSTSSSYRFKLIFKSFWSKLILLSHLSGDFLWYRFNPVLSHPPQFSKCSKPTSNCVRQNTVGEQNPPAGELRPRTACLWPVLSSIPVYCRDCANSAHGFRCQMERTAALTAKSPFLCASPGMPYDSKIETLLSRLWVRFTTKTASRNEMRVLVTQMAPNGVGLSPFLGAVGKSLR